MQACDFVNEVKGTTDACDKYDDDEEAYWSTMMLEAEVDPEIFLTDYYPNLKYDPAELFSVLVRAYYTLYTHVDMT